MPKFGIYSPTMGKREDFPVILLDKSITPECMNVQIEDGEIKTAKMREELFSKLVSTETVHIPTQAEWGLTMPGISQYPIVPFGTGSHAMIQIHVFDKGSLADGDAVYVEVISSMAKVSGLTAFEYPRWDGETETDTISGHYFILKSIVGDWNDDTGDNLKWNDYLPHTEGLSPSPEAITDNGDILTSYETQHKMLPDGKTAIRLERFVLPDGETSRLIAFSPRNIYYFNDSPTVKEWVLINPLVNPTETTGDQAVFTTSDYWDTCLYGNYICATNGYDIPIKWSGLTESGFVGFEYIDTRIDNETGGEYISSAKFIASYCNYLLLANVTINAESFGHQDYVFYSGIGDGVNEGGFVIGGYTDGGVPVIENSTDAGYMIITGNGEISGGMALYRGMLMIFKRYSIRKVWFNGSQIPFSQDEQNPDVGCFAPGSVIHDKEGNLFFFGSDRLFREISIGSISEGIPVTARNINTKLTPKIASAYIMDYNELWWAVPSGSVGAGSTELTGNNYVLCFGRGKWTVRDMPVVAFGEYVYQENYDYASLPYQNYTDVDEFGNRNTSSWDWYQYDMPQEAESIIDIASDVDGYLYSLHASYTDVGVEYESSFTLSTDMANKQALAYKKRILQMYLYFDITESNSAIVSVQYKRDTETNWVSAGSVTLSGNQKIVRKRLACDIRGGTFQFRISSFSPFRFIGIEFDYNFAGER